MDSKENSKEQSPQSQPKQKKQILPNLKLTSEQIIKEAKNDDIIKKLENLSLQNSTTFEERKDKNHNLSSILHFQNKNLNLSEFTSLKILGKGASGTVEQVQHIPSQKIYALKRIYVQDDETFQKHLNLEIKALISCESQHIVKCSGAFFQQGQMNMLLEYMDYGSLQNILKVVKDGISELILGAIAYQILLGLKYLHKDLKIIHRDIKPGNILINSQGKVKISDLGICGKLNSTFDMKSSWVGTTIYMSIERLKGEGYQFNEDIWSLGFTLLECKIGKHPLILMSNEEKQNQTIWSLIESLLKFEIPEIQVQPHIGDLFKDFIKQCLIKDPLKRPSAEDLLNHPYIKKCSTDKQQEYLKNWLGCLGIDTKNDKN